MKLLFGTVLLLLFFNPFSKASPCDTDSFALTLMASDSLFCLNDPVFFNAEVTGGIGAYSYKWSNSASTEASFDTRIKHSHWVRVSVTSAGCPSPVVDSVYLRVNKLEANFSLDRTNNYAVESKIRVHNASVNDELIVATIFKDDAIYRVFEALEKDLFEFSFSEGGAYYIKFNIYNASGAHDTLFACRATDTLHFEIKDKIVLGVPDAFSPGKHDNVNDSYFIWHEGVTNLEFFVFDRRGQRVFYSDALNFSWDGRTEKGRMLNGAYYYVLKASNALEEQVTSGILQIF